MQFDAKPRILSSVVHGLSGERLSHNKVCGVDDTMLVELSDRVVNHLGETPVVSIE